MKWLIQEMMNGNENVERMRMAVRNLHQDFLFVKMNADETLTVLDVDTRLPIENSEQVLKEFLADGEIVSYGSKHFDRLIQKLPITPGSFSNKNFEMDVIQSHIQKELLNFGYMVGELHQIEPEWEKFFIRPTGNTKWFDGTIMTKSELRQWKQREHSVDNPYRGHTLMVSELKEIEAEYRFFVVNGKVITGSSYMVDGVSNRCVLPTPPVWEYAQKMVDRFNLATAFVIDVAKTEKGMKVVEYNNFNTSGLYSCDEVRIVQAIEKTRNKHL